MGTADVFIDLLNKKRNVNKDYQKEFILFNDLIVASQFVFKKSKI